MFKSGFISIIGAANVGKSTLMNGFLNEKIAITTYKPQTTRTRLLGILTTSDYQMVFLDTPGIHVPKDKLGKFMVNMAEMSITDGDVILHVVDVSRRATAVEEEIEKKLAVQQVPIFLILNKIDKISKMDLLPLIEAHEKKGIYAEIIPVSALEQTGLEGLLESVYTYLEPGPAYFPGDQITDQPERVMVGEMIREKILLLMDEEVPHGVAVVVTAMTAATKKDVMHIEATIFCERESHKGMIIGKGGKMLKDIGMRARKDIENFLGERVFLDIWVKVKKDWKDSEQEVKRMGYEPK